MVAYDVSDIIGDISDVPESWVYKHYYKNLTGNKISQPFDGRIIKMKSVVNRDSNPSLCFFYKNEKYFWRDFSQGQGGNIIRFVAFHYNKTEGQSIGMIIRDYETFLSSGCDYEEDVVFRSVSKPEYTIVTDYFKSEDLDFWDTSKIDLTTLNKFQIRKVPEYNIKKGEESFEFRGRIYGFFSNEKGIYQLYQPNLPKIKYINIDTSYLIGSEQLKQKYNICLIISGLKDICAMDVIKLSCEYVAPSSENTLIPKDRIDWLKSKYEFVLSMLDNDEAGLKAMRRYEKVYGIPYVHQKYKKDQADNNKAFPLEKLRLLYSELINKKINEK